MRGWKTAAVAIAVCVGLVVGAAAFGAIPDSSGTISGCYVKRTGALRVIDAEAGASCLGREFPLSWNMQGRPGPPGPAGPSLLTREVLVTETAVANTFEGFDRKIAQAPCAEGEFITGGGFRIGASRTISAHVTVIDSLPSYAGSSPDQPPNVWTVQAIAPAGIGSWSIDARAICATPQ